MTCFAPGDELGEINAAVAGFAVVDPGLRSFEPGAEFALRQAGFLAHLAKESGNGGVSPVVLGLGRHAANVAWIVLDTISVSDCIWSRRMRTMFTCGLGGVFPARFGGTEMRFVGYLLVVAGSAIPALAQGTLYYTQADSITGLFTLDLSTGQRTLVGRSDCGGGLNNGLAPTSDSLLLYGSRRLGLNHTRIDGSGATQFGTLPIDGLGFDAANGNLYGADGSSFFTVDPDTGLKLSDLPSPGMVVGGLDYGNGKVYALGNGGSLMSYDVGSGDWITIGATGINFMNAGLAYDPIRDVLYAKNGVTGFSDRNLYRINPVTAEPTIIGDTGTGIGGGLAFVVPEPGAAVLLISAAMFLRRRR